MRSSERHTDADLARALGDRVGDGAVNSYTRQEQRHAAYHAGEQRGESRRQMLEPESIIHAVCVRERWEPDIDVGSSTQCRRQGLARVAAGSQENVVEGSVGCERQIEHVGLNFAEMEA